MNNRFVVLLTLPMLVACGGSSAMDAGLDGSAASDVVAADTPATDLSERTMDALEDAAVAVESSVEVFTDNAVRAEAEVDALVADVVQPDVAVVPDVVTPPDSMTGARPHPLYPALDLATLPGMGGGAIGAYQPPALPTTTRTVTVMGSGAQARAALQAACQMPGTSVMVPDAAGALGTIDLGNVRDCDVQFGPRVTAELLYLGHLPGPTVAPVQRVRIRGGQFAQVMVDPGSTDLTLDGVVINTGLVSSAQRASTGIYLLNNGDTGFVNRFALVHSIVRMVATQASPTGDRDGCAYLAGNARNVFFANNNIVTAGNRNSWGFRIGGGSNYVLIDNTVRVSFHKLVRMNDGPVDYVYIKGGTWMREATLTAAGLSLNDSFAQLGDLGTDRIYLHDPTVYLLSTAPVSFGASIGPMQAGRLWEARRIQWHARNESVVSDATLGAVQRACVAGARCDYGLGTHSYTYNPSLMFPAAPWRSLPTIAEDNPDNHPSMP